MIVSWNWLQDYVPLKMTPEQLALRLAMAGLNHESTAKVGDDLAIDLEVTSNRPDCLGHIGVAREISVLWDTALSVPEPEPQAAGPAASSLANVRIDAPHLCRRYTGRVIRNVKVQPSPDWLADRLRTVGLAVISNIVDATNYVMMECGQPLHAFDLDKLAGGQIIVREAEKDEPFVAIDHRQYTLQPGMCVIADQQRPVGLAGVMGGAETEVTEATTNLLIESADFAPLAIRHAARALRLHSPSSYRFERGVDPAGIEWASRRVSELILELAGGELAEGLIDVTTRPDPERQPIVRLSQLSRILGIDVPADEVRRILVKLGLEPQQNDDQASTWVPPTWRLDLAREIDLVEEVARIHGYDQIPEDAQVPMVPSYRRSVDRVLEHIRQVLLAGGFFEAMTASVVDQSASELFSPWTDQPPLISSTPMLRGADRLRRSLVPSLLTARRVNERLGNEQIELFETAKVYLPRPDALPAEPLMLSMTSGRDYRDLKGVVEAILAKLHIDLPLRAEGVQDVPLLDQGRSARLFLGEEPLGLLGELSSNGGKQAGVRDRSSVAELRVDVLQQHAQLVPQFRPVSPYPAIDYDLNFVVDEPIAWADVESTVRAAAGPLLESIEYRETYRDPKRDGPGRKRILFRIRLRSAEETLTGDQADAVRQAVIDACAERLAAELLG